MRNRTVLRLPAGMLAAIRADIRKWAPEETLIYGLARHLAYQSTELFLLDKLVFLTDVPR